MHLDFHAVGALLRGVYRYGTREIAMQKGEVKHIFFIAETKGSLQSMQLNAIENAKIDCCAQLFNEISTGNVKYHKVTCYQDIIDAITTVK